MREKSQWSSSRRCTLSQSRLPTPNSLKALTHHAEGILCLSQWLYLVRHVSHKANNFVQLAGINLVWFTERQVQLNCKEEGAIASCGMVPCGTIDKSLWRRVTETCLLLCTFILYMWQRERDNTKKSIPNIKTPRKKIFPEVAISHVFCDSTLPDNKSFLGFLSVSKAQGWLLISYLFTGFCLQILTGSIQSYALYRSCQHPVVLPSLQEVWPVQCLQQSALPYWLPLVLE